MKIVQESILASAIRSFCSSFFALIGFSLAAILALSIFLSIFSNKSDTFSTATTLILSDAEGTRKIQPAAAPVFLKIDIAGVIGTKELNAEKICKQLEESRHTAIGGERIRGILLRINSPGGSVLDSDIIYRALMEYKERYHTPIYAYVDGLCASGGMYIACAADKIYASDVSLIGHVGALMEFMNFSGTLDKLGIEAKTIIEGKGKDNMNPLRPWKEGEDAQYRSLLNFYYMRFIDLVTHARKGISKEDLIERHGAQVFAAPLAKDLGYIDFADASISQALRALTTETIGKETTYQFIELQTTNWLSDLLQAKASSPLVTGKMQHHLSDVPALHAKNDLPFFYFYRPSLSTTRE